MTPEQIERLADVAEFWANRLEEMPELGHSFVNVRCGRAQAYRQMAEVLRSEAIALLWIENAKNNGFKPCR